ncbi:MAG: SulP family inorganic anion transporter [Burkholderiales bacterium]
MPDDHAPEAAPPATTASRRRRAIALVEIVRELRGGVTAAAVSLGILLPLGLLPFASLGVEGAAVGIRAAFVAAAIGGLVIAFVGGSPVPGSGPRTSTSLIFAGFVASLAIDPQLRTADGMPWLFALAAMCVTLAGVFQIVLAALRMGSIVSYVPLPVVAGMMDGIAILVIVAQFRLLLSAPGGVSTSAFLVMGLTAAITWAISHRYPRAPWALIGIAIGSALYWIVTPVFPGPAGALLGIPARGLAVPFIDLSDVPVIRAHLPGLIASAAVIAMIASLESLLSAAALDARFMTRHQPNRMLAGQGIANVIVGLLGGMPVSTSAAVQVAMHRAGARRILSALVAALLLVAAMAAAPYCLAYVPMAATAGIMLVVSLGLFDQWGSTVFRQVRAGMRDREALWALGTVALVCTITVVFGFVLGVAVGILVSIVLFIAAQNRSLVRTVATGETRSSRRIYRDDEARALREHGARVRVVELEGSVFFGTAHKMERELESIAKGARFVIVDIRRVTNIDASGTHALERVASRLRARGAQLLIAGISPRDRHARALNAYGGTKFVPETWFADVDRALEHAERAMLDGIGLRPSDGELPLARATLFEGLDERQQARLASRLVRQELAPREVLFRRGEPGDRVFVLAKGSVTIISDAGDEPGHRLATFAPGVVFGEAAMLDGGGRTATAVADEDCVLYALTRDALDSLREEDSGLALAVLRNIARQLSARLRFANQTIDALR